MGSNTDEIKTLGHNSGFSLEERMETVTFNKETLSQSLYETQDRIRCMLEKIAGGTSVTHDSGDK